MKEYTNYSLRKYHTFGMDVRASYFAEYSSVGELNQLLLRFKNEWKNLPWFHIGGGSNLLFTSACYQGVILHSAIKGMEIIREDNNEIILRVGAGEVWDELVAYSVEHGWGGMENLSLIPGEVGAGAVQNIGAYGVEAKDLIVNVESVEIATLQERMFTNEECVYSYRRSIFKEELKGQYIITYVTFRLQKHPQYKLEYGNIRKALEASGKDLSLDNVRQSVISIRNNKLPDPVVLGNAGSFFMNPVVSRECFTQLLQKYPSMPFYEIDADHVKIPAGWMIEQCGWKGRSLGCAGVYEKQALVLVNLGGATGEEVLALSTAVRASVKDKFGIDIYPEVNII